MPAARSSGAGKVKRLATPRRMKIPTATRSRRQSTSDSPDRYADTESGLYYNWNRYYDPKTGRYLTSDPIGLAGGLNTFSYVNSNPLSFVDPTGLNAAGAIGIGAAGLCIKFPKLCGAAASATGAAIGAGICAVTGICAESRASGEETLPIVNPGRDCDGKCKPCPPGKRWFVSKPGHGHENGYWHTIDYNQNPDTCECFPDRPSGGLDGF